MIRFAGRRPAWADSCALLTPGPAAPRPGQEIREPMQAEAASSHCADCHLCSVPTARVAVPEGLPAHDDGPPDQPPRAGRGGRTPCCWTIWSTSTSRCTSTTEAHASMAQMGKDCATCHHYSPPGTIPPCKECHGLGAESGDLRKPNLKGAYHRQCMACHVEWSHETQCGACHARAPGRGATAAGADPTDIVGTGAPAARRPRPSGSTAPPTPRRRSSPSSTRSTAISSASAASTATTRRAAPTATTGARPRTRRRAARPRSTRSATTATRRTRAPSATTRRSAPASPTTAPAGPSIPTTRAWTAGPATRGARTSAG